MIEQLTNIVAGVYALVGGPILSLIGGYGIMFAAIAILVPHR